MRWSADTGNRSHAELPEGKGGWNFVFFDTEGRKQFLIIDERVQGGEGNDTYGRAQQRKGFLPV